MTFRGTLAAGAVLLLVAACGPAADDEQLGQPTPPQLATPAPALETHPADPVIPMPQEGPGTFPPALPPSPGPATSP